MLDITKQIKRRPARFKFLTYFIMFLFIVLFLYSGISKVIEFSRFKEQIAASPFKFPLSNKIALMIPIIEVGNVLLLCIPKWKMIGLHIALCLMIAFTVYIIVILLVDDNIPCSCGGLLENMSWPGHLIFNSIFILLAILGILIERDLKRNNQIVTVF